MASIEAFGGFGGDSTVMGLARDTLPSDSSLFLSNASADGALPERVDGPVPVDSIYLTT